MKYDFLARSSVSLVALTGLLILGAGCNKQPAEQSCYPAGNTRCATCTPTGAERPADRQ